MRREESSPRNRVSRPTLVNRSKIKLIISRGHAPPRQAERQEHASLIRTHRTRDDTAGQGDPKLWECPTLIQAFFPSSKYDTACGTTATFHKGKAETGLSSEPGWLGKTTYLGQRDEGILDIAMQKKTFRVRGHGADAMNRKYSPELHHRRHWAPILRERLVCEESASNSSGFTASDTIAELEALGIARQHVYLVWSLRAYTRPGMHEGALCAAQSLELKYGTQLLRVIHTFTRITFLTTMASSPIDGKNIDLRDVEKGSVHDTDLAQELDERFGAGKGGGNRRSVLPPLPGEGETDDESLAPPRPAFLIESHYGQSPLEIHPASQPNFHMFHELKNLQAELSEFLAQHVAKTTSLQASLQPGDPLKLLRKRGSAFERENGGRPFDGLLRDVIAESMLFTGSILSPGSTGIAAHSHDAPLSRLNLGSEPGRSPVDLHREALEVFLEGHLSNLQALQDSLNRVSEPRQPKLDASGGVFDGGDGLAEECVNEFVGSILSSFFAAIFITLFLTFSHSILARRFFLPAGSDPEQDQPFLGKASIPFNVSLLFSSFSLAFLIIALVISLWGIVTTSMRRLEHRPPSLVQVHLHLLLTRQLHLSALLSRLSFLCLCWWFVQWWEGV
ncbi:hypothetical protein NMY22_g8672 [Coprinellus aureogranulatus]|nr:hypothetical protein NMY22_g8672 [Coprinellus aureogranulatus]